MPGLDWTEVGREPDFDAAREPFPSGASAFLEPVKKMKTFRIENSTGNLNIFCFLFFFVNNSHVQSCLVMTDFSFPKGSLSNLSKHIKIPW